MIAEEHLTDRPRAGHDVVAGPVPHRLEYIDGLRALAALWVVLHHLIELAEPTRLLEMAILGPVTRSLFYGQFPVMIFLMLSGFVLYYPCVRKDPEAPRLTTTYGDFCRRRYRRIAPPYLWAGAFCLVMVAIPAFQDGRWIPLSAVDLKVIGSHLFFVHNLFPDYATTIDYPMWSIGLEVQLYLLFPLMVWGFLKLGSRAVLVSTIALTTIVFAGYRHVPSGIGAVLRDGPLAYLEVFALGMFAAALTVRGRKMLPNWAWGGVALVGFGMVRFGSGNGLVHDLATSAAAFSILMLCIGAGGATSRVLSTPRLVAIGIFSYSLYLVHAPVLHVLDVALDGMGVGADAEFAVLVLLGVPVILGVSYAFHCVFERPFMRASRVPAPVTATTLPRSVSQPA